MVLVASAFAGCHNSGGSGLTGGAAAGGAGGTHAGGPGGSGGGTGGSGHGGASGSGAGGSGASGSGAGGSGAGGTSGAGGSGQGGAGASVAGAGGTASCTPGVEATLITDCGYPISGSTPLASVEFSESEVLRAIQPSGSAANGVVRVFYSDEHALTLGVRQVVVKSAAGMMMTDYPVSPLPASPSSVMDPQTGTNELVGPTSGLDISQRPMWPALFVTDISADPNSRAGDWQMGGRPRGPNALFGTWKAAVRTVDTTVMPNLVKITPDPDPMKNMWNLGGGDPVPAGLKGEGFSAEARWNVNLTPGHSYRIQVMVHDGDQNKAGGDSGEACVIFCAGGAAPPVAPDAGVTPPPMCPPSTMACGQDAIDPSACPAGTVCANGCCLPIIK